MLSGRTLLTSLRHLPSFSSSPILSSSTRYSSSSFRKKLVIFDKDGTLLSFEKPWLAWCNRFQARLVEHTAEQVSEQVEDKLLDLGVDLAQSQIGLGKFAEACFTEVKQDLSDAFQETLRKISEDERAVQEIMDSCRQEGDGGYPLTNVRGLFRELREQDYTIAIATADCAEGVNMFLKDSGVSVDFVMCSNNTDLPPKPSGVAAQKICETLGVRPDDVVMIGDTPTDMAFGVAGEFGLIVGVTTGVGGGEDLVASGADVILDDLDKLVPLLSKFDSDRSEENRI